LKEKKKSSYIKRTIEALQGQGWMTTMVKMMKMMVMTKMMMMTVTLHWHCD
jgi:hypothetical protein